MPHERNKKGGREHGGAVTCSTQEDRGFLGKWGLHRGRSTERRWQAKAPWVNVTEQLLACPVTPVKNLLRAPSKFRELEGCLFCLVAMNTKQK